MALALKYERRLIGRARSRKPQKVSSAISGTILFEENWVSPQHCEQLISLYKRFWDPKVGQSYNGNNAIDHSVLIGNAKIERYLWRLAQKARNRVQAFFGVSGLLIESLFLAALVEGGSHEVHADNQRYVRNQWVPNHTPQREYTSILYLNSEFSGGALCFPQRKVRISPSRGSLVAFPSSGDFIHAVEPVNRGVRYSMPIWFTSDKRFAVWEE